MNGREITQFTTSSRKAATHTGASQTLCVKEFDRRKMIPLPPSKSKIPEQKANLAKDKILATIFFSLRFFSLFSKKYCVQFLETKLGSKSSFTKASVSQLHCWISCKRALMLGDGFSFSAEQIDWVTLTCKKRLHSHALTSMQGEKKPAFPCASLESMLKAPFYSMIICPQSTSVELVEGSCW